MVAVLGAVLVVLTPLAYTSTVDPNSPGFWDNGDFDDVILFLLGDLHFLDVVHAPSILALGRVWEGFVEHPAGVFADLAYDSGAPRAPPADVISG